MFFRSSIPTLSPRERVPEGRVRVLIFEKASFPRKNPSLFTALTIAFLLLTSTAGLAIASEFDPPPLPSASRASDSQDEQTPLAVPRPTALALQYERGGNLLWV